MAAPDITTGPEIIQGGLAAVIFAVIGSGGIWLNHRFWPEFANQRFVKRWNWGLIGLVGVGGLIAIIVGLICWATGTEFRAT